MITENKVKIYPTGRVDIDKTILGRQNEKKVTKLVFEIPEELDGFNKTIEFLFNGEKVSDVIFNNEYLIDNNVSCHLDLSFQVIFTDSDGNEVFKSDMQPVRFEKSINAVDPVPSAEEVSIYNSLITALKEVTEGIENININVVKEGTTTTLTITKADGTQESYQVEDGDDYILTDEDKLELVEKIEADIQSTINNIEDKAEHAEVIARGRATGYVFDTLEDLETWLQDEANISKLTLGDNFYIRALNTPDYWWDGADKQQLEAEKPDLSNLVDKNSFVYDEETETLSINI